MSHFCSSTPNWKIVERHEKLKVESHVKRVFGRTPDSFRFEKSDRGNTGLCFVKVCVGSGDPLEFLLAEGWLVGIPPKNWHW